MLALAELDDRRRGQRIARLRSGHDCFSLARKCGETRRGQRIARPWSSHLLLARTKCGETRRGQRIARPWQLSTCFSPARNAARPGAANGSVTVASVAACDPTEPAKSIPRGNDHDNDEERRHDHAEPGHDAYEPLTRDRCHLLLDCLHFNASVL